MDSASDYGYSTFIYQDTLHVKLKNCGAVFFPKQARFTSVDFGAASLFEAKIE
jgi:hypothetical protein